MCRLLRATVCAVCILFIMHGYMCTLGYQNPENLAGQIACENYRSRRKKLVFRIWTRKQPRKITQHRICFPTTPSKPVRKTTILQNKVFRTTLSFFFLRTPAFFLFVLVFSGPWFLPVYVDLCMYIYIYMCVYVFADPE